MQEYPIPKALWESIDAVLFSKGLSLARELAKELGVSPKPLIDLLKADDRGKFTIVEDDEANMYQCPALIQTGVVYMRCRAPTLGLAAKLCSVHERNPKDVPVDLPFVQRLITPEATYMVKGTEVLTLNGRSCGYLKGTTLTLFEIDDTA